MTGGTVKRLATSLMLGVAVGVATAFVFVIVYAIVDLYLSGHSMKPLWFDTAADVLLPLLFGGTALAAGVGAWRAGRPR